MDRNPPHIHAIYGEHVAAIDIRIKALLAAALALVSVGMLVLERIKKDSDRMFLYARIVTSAALVIGAVNALLI